MFTYVEERLQSPMLDLAFHLTPWDRPAFPCNTATLSSIRLAAGDINAEGLRTFDAFRAWCADHDVRLVTCRLAQNRLVECGFLEARGFRFVELNYQPKIGDLGRFVDDPEIDILPALPSDVAPLSAFVAEGFKTGRMHVDPWIDPEIGNRRYAAWVSNAFENPDQRVMKFIRDGRIFACCVVGQSTPTIGTWSLFCLAPGVGGQGLGRRGGLGQRSWKAMLALHHREGTRRIVSSVSSLNVAAFNLYVALGSHFPAPEITLHWCPFGPVRLS
jgi:RimJ/RimL family protein N-acetyltransferase